VEREFTYLRDKFDGFAQVAGWRPGDVTSSRAMRRSTHPRHRHHRRAVDVLGAHAFVGRTLRVATT
jgi:hypothetical protein